MLDETLGETVHHDAVRHYHLPQMQMTAPFSFLESLAPVQYCPHADELSAPAVELLAFPSSEQPADLSPSPTLPRDRSVTSSRLPSSSVVTYSNWDGTSSGGWILFYVTGAAGSVLGVNRPNAPPWPLALSSIDSACDTDRPPRTAPCILSLTIPVLNVLLFHRFVLLPIWVQYNITHLALINLRIYTFFKFWRQAQKRVVGLKPWSEWREWGPPIALPCPWQRHQDPHVPCCLATITHL